MKLSVLTTVYNRPRHAAFLLRALALQTRRPDEVVLADDGSDPPAKRAVVFKAINLFCPLATTAADHKVFARDRYLISGDRKAVLGRIMRHLAEILALDAKGKLDAENVIKTCFPDMVKANWSATRSCPSAGASIRSRRAR